MSKLINLSRGWQVTAAICSSIVDRGYRTAIYAAFDCYPAFLALLKRHEWPPVKRCGQFVGYHFVGYLLWPSIYLE